MSTIEALQRPITQVDWHAQAQRILGAGHAAFEKVASVLERRNNKVALRLGAIATAGKVLLERFQDNNPSVSEAPSVDAVGNRPTALFDETVTGQGLQDTEETNAYDDDDIYDVPPPNRIRQSTVQETGQVHRSGSVKTSERKMGKRWIIVPLIGLAAIGGWVAVESLNDGKPQGGGKAAPQKPSRDAGGKENDGGNTKPSKPAHRAVHFRHFNVEQRSGIINELHERGHHLVGYDRFTAEKAETVYKDLQKRYGSNLIIKTGVKSRNYYIVNDDVRLRHTGDSHFRTKAIQRRADEDIRKLA